MLNTNEKIKNNIKLTGDTIQEMKENNWTDEQIKVYLLDLLRVQKEGYKTALETSRDKRDQEISKYIYEPSTEAILYWINRLFPTNEFLELRSLYKDADFYHETSLNDMAGSGYFPTDPRVTKTNTKQYKLNQLTRLKNFLHTKQHIQKIRNEYLILAKRNALKCTPDERKLLIKWKFDIEKMIHSCNVFIDQIENKEREVKTV